MEMAHKTHVISRKILMVKSQEEKFFMYLKFHINPHYIIYVINFILTHTIFFPWLYMYKYVEHVVENNIHINWR